MLVAVWFSISVPKINYIAICLTSYRISASLHLLLNNSCTLHFVKKIASDFRQFNKTFATCIKLSFLATLAIGRPSPALSSSAVALRDASLFLSGSLSLSLSLSLSHTHTHTHTHTFLYVFLCAFLRVFCIFRCAEEVNESD